MTPRLVGIFFLGFLWVGSVKSLMLLEQWFFLHRQQLPSSAEPPSWLMGAGPLSEEQFRPFGIDRILSPELRSRFTLEWPDHVFGNPTTVELSWLGLNRGAGNKTVEERWVEGEVALEGHKGFIWTLI